VNLKKMRFCVVCKKYTLERIHCERNSLSAHPAPFKPEDVYGDFRRVMKGFNITKNDRYAI